MKIAVVGTGAVGGHFGARLAPRLARDGVVVPLQNGVDAPAILAAAVARMASESGTTAPVHATLHAVVKPFAGGKPA